MTTTKTEELTSLRDTLLKQAARQDILSNNAQVAHESARLMREAAAALTQRPAAQTERDTGPRLLREVFALCEDTVDKMTAESTEFSRGRAFEAKGIARAIGTWFQDEYCGQSHMGEPSLPAPQRPAAQEVDEQRRFEAGSVVLQHLRDTGAPYRAIHHMLIALHGDPEAKPTPQQATPEPVGGSTEGEFFAFDPEGGNAFYKTRQEAINHAKESLKYYQDGAKDHGEWDEDVEHVRWGVVMQRAKATNISATEDGESSCDYELQDVATRPAPGVPDVEDLRDRLVAISYAVAHSDDRAAQSMLSETLRLLAAAQAKGGDHG